ncbi:MAG: hypothetical protein HY314_00455 [Acidobacteria bacterium]|nr:hypothetical protein [Acidobacteriota bacterium]
MKKLMMILGIASLFCLGLLSASFTPAAKADEWNEKTIVTFTEPVEVPGRVLPPGRYVFRLLDSPGNRNIAQIFNEDMTELYATVLAVSDFRPRPSDEATITLVRNGSAPRFVKEWFYPGKLHGHEFIYPEERGVELARVTRQPVRTMPSETNGHATNGHAKASTETEAAEPSDRAEAMTMEPSDEADAMATEGSLEDIDGKLAQARETTPPADSQAVDTEEGATDQLPQTASSLPLLGLLGIGAVGVGLALRFASKRAA